MHSKRRSRVVQQAFSLQSFLESALFLANLMELLKLQPSKNPTQQNILLKRRENVTRNFQQQKLSILKILLSIRATKSKKVLIFFYKHRAFSSTCVFLFFFRKWDCSYQNTKSQSDETKRKKSWKEIKKLKIKTY